MNRFSGTPASNLSGRRTAARSVLTLSAAGLALAMAAAGCKPTYEVVQPPPATGHPTPTQALAMATVGHPLAAAVASDAQTLYVVGFDASGQVGLGIGTISSPLPAIPMSGAAISFPIGIAVSSDGKTLLLADIGAAGVDGNGGVYKATPSGDLTAITNGELRRPTAVAFSSDEKSVYVTAVDTSDDQPGVFKLSLNGGSAELLYKGPPLTNPSGMAVANDGSLYVADSTSVGAQTGNIYRIQSNRAIQINKKPLSLGYPAGLAAAGNQSIDLLYVSQPAVGADWLFRLSPEGTSTPVTIDGITAPTDATTLVRAPKADAWVLVDSVIPGNTAAEIENPSGRVVQLAP